MVLFGAGQTDRYHLARRILAEGHEIGAHMFTHPELTNLPAWRRRLEISLTQNALAGATVLRAYGCCLPWPSAWPHCACWCRW